MCWERWRRQKQRFVSAQWEMFETLEAAIAAYQSLETEKKGLEEEKAKLIKKNSELIAEKNATKSRYAKFEEYVDKDIDIAELLTLKDSAGSSEEAIKAKFEAAYQKDRQTFEQRLKAIEEERRQEKEAREREQQEAIASKLKADALSEFSKEKYGIRNPEQFWMLFGNQIRRDEQKGLVAGEGLEKPLAEYIEAIANDDDNLHHFRPKGGSGGGIQTGTNSRKLTANPWKKETFNLTQQGQIVKNNPELAKRLKSEAGIK